jgi:hypothetical protein
MSEQRTEIDQLCGILSQFDKTTIVSAVARVVSRADLVRLGIEGSRTGPFVIPPVILYPGGGVAPGEIAGQVKSTDCGPKENEGKDKGDWNRDRGAARKSAR